MKSEKYYDFKRVYFVLRSTCTTFALKKVIYIVYIMFYFKMARNEKDFYLFVYDRLCGVFT